MQIELIKENNIPECLTNRNTPAAKFYENNSFKEIDDMILMFKGVRGDIV